MTHFRKSFAAGALAIAIFAAPLNAAVPLQAGAALDPARLAASHELIDQLLPPATRDAMMQGMLAPMMANIRQVMTQGQNAQTDPKIKAKVDAFLEEQQAKTIADLKANMPGMIDAMSNAYARRLDVAQLHELKAFFTTPTGQAYMQVSRGAMSDPDVANWQRETMTKSLHRVQADVVTFAKSLAADIAQRKKP